MPETSLAETLEAQYLDRMSLYGVPEHLRHGLAFYLAHHIQPGHFLIAVLQNDLIGAIGRGDDNSIAGLKALVVFLYNGAPATAFGTPEKVDQWLSAEGRS